MDNTQTITLDIMNDKTYDYIYTKQYDKGREIYFTIVDRGTPISLSGLNVGFELKKPDGNICVYTDTADPSVLAIEGNQVLLTLTDQMTVLSGKLPYQISLLDGEKIISTVTGFVWCEKSAVQYNDVESVSGGSLIEDIQHIDEKINGIMLCGENPPTDDVGDENSRYVQIVDGKVVKEFTKYDGHWVDFPKGGGAGLDYEDFLWVPTDSSMDYMGGIPEATVYNPYMWDGMYSTVTFTRTCGVNNSGKFWIAVSGGYDMRNIALFQYLELINPEKIEKINFSMTVSALDRVDHTSTLGYANQKLAIGFIDTIKNKTIDATSAELINKKVIDVEQDPNDYTRYIYPNPFTGSINVPTGYGTVVLCITSGIWNVVIDSLEFVMKEG